jgi:hypothetical protein
MKLRYQNGKALHVTECGVEFLVQAPEGRRLLRYEWTTPQPHVRALHRVVGWGKESMRTEKVRGRSKILKITAWAASIEPFLPTADA